MKPCRPFICWLLIAYTSVLSAGTAGPAGSVTDDTRILTADTQQMTAAGHGFVAPASWSIKAMGSAIILTAPEGGSHIALVDVVAKDADAAVAAAWAACDVRARPQLESASDGAPRNGWEQIRNYRYATAAKDRRETAARAMRHKDRWIVAIRDMATDVIARRDAQLELIFGRLQPKGYARESFAGKTAHTLDATRIDALKQFIDDARRQFDVPGVAIGIVQDGKVVLAQGFGVRELGKPGTVDADTLFMIASNTKPLTTSRAKAPRPGSTSAAGAASWRRAATTTARQPWSRSRPGWSDGWSSRSLSTKRGRRWYCTTSSASTFSSRLSKPPASSRFANRHDLYLTAGPCVTSCVLSHRFAAIASSAVVRIAVHMPGSGTNLSTFPLMQ